MKIPCERFIWSYNPLSVRFVTVSDSILFCRNEQMTFNMAAHGIIVFDQMKLKNNQQQNK